MLLEEARHLAHERGVEMRPRDPATTIDGLFDQVDCADLSIMVLEESYPIGQTPSQRFNRGAYEQWVRDQEKIRQLVWEAFDAGTRGKPFRVLAPAPSAMH